MNKKLWTAALVSLMLVVGAPLLAGESMTGEVLDLGCYEKGQSGPGHAKCATRCLGGGAPMGLLVNGEVYEIDSTSSSKAAVDTMREHGGKNVTVMGEKSEKDGKKTLRVSSAKAAA